MLGDFQCYLMQKTNKRTKNTFADLRILRSGHYPRLFRWSLNVKGLYKKERDLIGKEEVKIMWSHILKTHQAVCF